MDIEKAFMDHMIQVNIDAGKTYKEAKKVCKGFKKNHPKAWKKNMDEWFDEVHPY